MGQATNTATIKPITPHKYCRNCLDIHVTGT
uniref:Uncharacterized protein n=1 Tax=Rhizophora mucronata TaxID=61149 RepID=A0A2P2QXK5_RHIMU